MTGQVPIIENIYVADGLKCCVYNNTRNKADKDYEIIRYQTLFVTTFSAMRQD